MREDEARFHNMADKAPVIMWVNGVDGACTYRNRGWYAYAGQTEAEAETLRLGWLDAMHPHVRGWSGEAFLAGNGRPAPLCLEYRLCGAYGDYRWLTDASQPRLAEDGRFLGCIGSMTDIHDRQDAEDCPVGTKRRFDASLGNTSQAIFLMDEREPLASRIRDMIEA